MTCGLGSKSLRSAAGEWDRVIGPFRRYAKANGIDLFAGRRLPRLLREAGVIEIQSRLLANAYELGHPAWSILNDFLENLEGRFVETGLADADELEALSSALARHIDDPDTYVISHLFVQAWGRKPA